MQETQVQSLGQQDLLEKEMATHSNMLAWEIPWTKEPGGLQFMGSQKSQTKLRNNMSNKKKNANEISSQPNKLLKPWYLIPRGIQEEISTFLLTFWNPEGGC